MGWAVVPIHTPILLLVMILCVLLPMMILALVFLDQMEAGVVLVVTQMQISLRGHNSKEEGEIRTRGHRRHRRLAGFLAGCPCCTALIS